MARDLNEAVSLLRDMAVRESTRAQDRGTHQDAKHFYGSSLVATTTNDEKKRDQKMATDKVMPTQAPEERSHTPNTRGNCCGIFRGRNGFKGVVLSWAKCSELVTGVSAAVHKKFGTYREAEDFAHGRTGNALAARALNVLKNTTIKTAKLDSGADESYWPSTYSSELTGIWPCSGSVKSANGGLCQIVGQGKFEGIPVKIVENFEEKLIAVNSLADSKHGVLFSEDAAFRVPLAGVDFGFCDMVMGVGIINGNCSSISGCGAQVGAINYAEALYDSMDDCMLACPIIEYGGCTYTYACNYDPNAAFEDGSCLFPPEHCPLNPETPGGGCAPKSHMNLIQLRVKSVALAPRAGEVDVFAAVGKSFARLALRAGPSQLEERIKDWAKPIQDLSTTMECNGRDIRETPALIALVDGCDDDAQIKAIDALTTVATELVAAGKASADGPDAICFYAKTTEGNVFHVRRWTERERGRRREQK